MAGRVTPKTPAPSTYSSVEGMCVYCRRVVKLQVIQGSFQIRCPKCGSMWENADAYAELYEEMIGGAARLLLSLKNSARAMGWRG